jgi:hypothetical protein
MNMDILVPLVFVVACCAAIVGGPMLVDWLSRTTIRRL